MSEIRKPFETYAHYPVGKGTATLSAAVNDMHVRVGISYCHPRDGINKKFGRSVARARRDSASDFSFDFKRNKQTLGDQLHAEFEAFVAESGVAMLIAQGLGTKIRVGAPPWAIHSLNRELRRRGSTVEVETPSCTNCGCD